MAGNNPSCGGHSNDVPWTKHAESKICSRIDPSSYRAQFWKDTNWGVAVINQPASIYLRTSTEDQRPEDQREACLKLARARGYNVPVDLIFQEKLSAFQEGTKRPFYLKVKEMAHRGEICAVVVFSVSRWVRNRTIFLQDLAMFSHLKTRFHSVSQSYLETINIPGPIGQAISSFLWDLNGSWAEEDSAEKGRMVRKAVVKGDDGVTRSTRGNKWGRKTIENRKKGPQVSFMEILEKYEELRSLRKTAEELGIGKSTVSRVVSQNRDGKNGG